MEMHQVRYFLAVAEHLNFTRAAERLHVAQPSLTRAIQRLEDDLGGMLFRRERTKTHLTELGRMMLPHLQATLAAAQEAQRQALSFRKRETGHIVVGACSATCARLGGPMLAAVAREIRGLDMSVVVAPAAELVERLLAGSMDAGLLSSVREPDRTGDLDRIDTRVVAVEPFTVVFGPGHRFALAPEVTLEDLDGEALIVATSAGYEGDIAAAMEARGIARVVRYGSTDERWLAEMVRRGLACAVVPETAASSHGLPFRRLRDVPMTHRLMLTTVAGRRHSPALAVLVRHADAIARSLAVGLESGENLQDRRGIEPVGEVGVDMRQRDDAV